MAKTPRSLRARRRLRGPSLVALTIGLLLVWYWWPQPEAEQLPRQGSEEVTVSAPVSVLDDQSPPEPSPVAVMPERREADAVVPTAPTATIASALLFPNDAKAIDLPRPPIQTLVARLPAQHQAAWQAFQEEFPDVDPTDTEAFLRSREPEAGTVWL